MLYDHPGGRLDGSGGKDEVTTTATGDASGRDDLSEVAGATPRGEGDEEAFCDCEEAPLPALLPFLSPRSRAQASAGCKLTTGPGSSCEAAAAPAARFTSEDWCIHLERGAVEAGIADQRCESAMWCKEVVDEGFFRLVNRQNPAHKLHVEYGTLEAGPVRPRWFSAMWREESVADGCFTLVSRWKPDKVLHVENGVLEVGQVKEKLWSSHWRRDDAGGSYFRLIVQQREPKMHVTSPANTPSASSKLPKGNSDDESILRVKEAVRDAWGWRLAGGSGGCLDAELGGGGGDLDAELKMQLKEGFPEFDEWTQADTVQRMLRAALGDEDMAVAMLVRAIECRVRRRELFQSRRCKVTCDIRVIGRDLDERPVIYLCAKNQRSTLIEALPQIFLAFEVGVELSPPDDGQVVLIVDLHGFMAHLNTDPMALREFASSFGAVYADRLRRVLVVDCLYMAQTFWSVCRPLLPERTRRKVSFVSEREARASCQERLNKATCERVISSFEVNRNARSTPEDREAHARKTTISLTPLGFSSPKAPVRALPRLDEKDLGAINS